MTENEQEVGGPVGEMLLVGQMVIHQGRVNRVPRENQRCAAVHFAC